MLARVALGLALATTWSDWSQAQTIGDKSNQRPTIGGTFGVAIPPNPPGTFAQRHRSPSGSLCLQVTGMARPLGANDKLFNHWIYVKNECSVGIKLQVCYYSTTSCMDMSVPGRGTKEAILGTLPSIKDFRYEYRERF